MPAYELNAAADNGILTAKGLNTLVFKDPYSKICFTAMLTSQFEKTIYFDLDTVFTAYLKAGLIANNTRKIDIFLPREDGFSSMLKDVLASMSSASLVIFDSVNSFYNLYFNRERLSSESASQKIGRLNQFLAICIMLLVKHGVALGIPVLVTSMVRYRNDKGWVQSPASRRLLQRKSVVKLGVEKSKEDLVVTIQKHPTLSQDTTIIYRGKGKVVTI